jgi:hypothetical protein
MPLFIELEVRARAKRAIGLYEGAVSILTKQMRKQAAVAQHDIFLSHAYDDKELVLGVALLMEDMGYSVYIDWRDDPSFDRKRVTAQTTEKLRVRMKASRCLFYSTTEHASESKWMPWELGYKDGQNTRAAILPILGYSTDSYSGQEYLGVHPYVSHGPDTTGKHRLWIRRSATCYVNFDSWLSGHDPTERS